MFLHISKKIVKISKNNHMFQDKSSFIKKVMTNRFLFKNNIKNYWFAMKIEEEINQQFSPLESYSFLVSPIFFINIQHKIEINNYVHVF